MVFYISAQASLQLQTLLPPLLQCQVYGLPPLAFSSHVANIFHTGPLKPNDGDLNQADLSYPGPLGFQQAPQLGGLPLKQEAEDAGPCTQDDGKQLPPACKLSPKP